MLFPLLTTQEIQLGMILTPVGQVALETIKAIHPITRIILIYLVFVPMRLF